MSIASIHSEYLSYIPNQKQENTFTTNVFNTIGVDFVSVVLIPFYTKEEQNRSHSGKGN